MYDNRVPHPPLRCPCRWSDPNCPATVQSAWDGGFAHVDVYMFPDPTGGSPAGQVQSMISALSAAGITKGGKPPNTFGMVWLDIEGRQYWHSDIGTNQAVFNGLAAELAALGQVRARRNPFLAAVCPGWFTPAYPSTESLHLPTASCVFVGRLLAPPPPLLTRFPSLAIL